MKRYLLLIILLLSLSGCSPKYLAVVPAEGGGLRVVHVDEKPGINRSPNIRTKTVWVNGKPYRVRYRTK